jgi:hypothetical protein
LIHRITASARARRSLTALLLSTLPGLATFAFASCGGDRPGAGAATAVATPGITPSAAATAQPPRMLPVTPVSIDYEIVDPAFNSLPGARAIYGNHAGSGYQIEVPEDWSGSVVYYAHGFRGNPPALTVSAPPLRQYFIDHGFAWAASSYSRNGYEPGDGARDTLALRDVVERELGAPARSYLYGQSMGGHVATFSLEQYPQAYDGAFAECGVVSGNEILDYFLSWGTLAAYLTGNDLYGLTTDAGRFGTVIYDSVAPALGPLDDPTDAGRIFADVIMHLSGGPRPFFREGLAANYAFNFTILVNAVANAGPANAASQNVDTVYTVSDGMPITSDELNRAVHRIAANETYRDAARYPEFAPMTGEIERPLIAIHNTGDLFVPISLEQSYARTVEAAGNSDLLVQRAVRRAGHCNFTQAERIRAFEDLVAWVETGARPQGDDLSGDLRQAGRAWTDPAEDGDPGGETP